MPVLDMKPEFSPLTAALRRATASVQSEIDRAKPVIGAAVSEAFLPVLIEHTPEGTGELRDSSGVRSSVALRDVALEFFQDATSKPNPDGTGGGFFYAQSVWHGRKAIVAPSDGEWSTGKHALRTPWGYRKSVAAAPGTLYPEDALAEALPSIVLELGGASAGISAGIARTISGV